MGAGKRIRAAVGAVLTIGLASWAFVTPAPAQFPLPPGVRPAPETNVPAQSQNGPAVTPPSASPLARIGTMQFRHGSRILALAWSPDGKLVAVGGGNGPVRQWDARSGLVVRQMKEPWVQALAFSPDGRLFATGGTWKTVRVWEVNTGRVLHQLKAHSGTVRGLAFARDGSALVSASQDGTLRAWDPRNGQYLGQMTGHEGGANCAAVAPDGKSVASGGNDRALRLWDLATGRATLTCDAGANVLAVAYAPDGAGVLAACDDGKVRVWDVARGKELRAWQAHAGPVLTLQLSSDGATAYTTGYDNTLCAWNVATGAKVRAIPQTPGDVDALALAPDGKTLAVAGRNQLVRFWNAADGTAVPGPPEAFLGAVQALAVSPDGATAVVADGVAVSVVDTATRRTRAKLFGSGPGEPSVAFSPDGRLLATAAAGKPVKLWTTADRKPALDLPVEGGRTVQGLAFAPDGRTLAAGGPGGVRLFAVPDGTLTRELPHPAGVRAVAFSADGKWLAGAGTDRVVVWDAASGQVARQFGEDSPAATVAFAPVGPVLASGHFDSVIRLWDVEAGKELRACEGHASAVFALAFSRSGLWLTSAGYDGTVRTWEVASGQPVNVWKGHTGPAHAVAVSADGRQVWSGGADTTVLVWDATGRAGQPAVNVAGQGEQLWKDLCSRDGPTGHRALWALAGSGADAVELLHKRVFLVDRNEVDKLVNDLNANKFAVREKASVALAGYGQWIKGRLAEAAANPASLESKLRLEALLNKLNNPEAVTLEQERFRLKRVMEVLEQQGTPRARDLLVNLTRGAVETDIAAEARAALARLEARGKR